MDDAKVIGRNRPAAPLAAPVPPGPRAGPAFVALPACTCILDDNGIIVEANAAWNARGAGGPGGTGAGANYLAACERAGSRGDPDGAAIGTRLRAVVDGLLGEFAYEYSCAGPAGIRWFVARAASFMERGRRWTVVLHDDVTAFKSEAAVLAEVAARLDRALTARDEALRA